MKKIWCHILKLFAGEKTRVESDANSKLQRLLKYQFRTKL